MLAKTKEKIKPYKNDIFIVLVIILVALISFGLGRLSKIRENKMPVTIENLSANMINSQENIPQDNQNIKNNQVQINSSQGMLIGSKNGTKYHFPWCSGAQRIKEENKIWFSNKEEAEKAGYSPA
ncbi:MAG: hypothetical protein AAB491_03070, partial [Patescibacteria group bacterium]